jgi:hypothetical protein
MLQGVGWSHVGESLNRPIAKGAAAGGENNPPKPCLRMTFEALEDRVVFAIDRQQLDVMLAGGGHHEFPREDENFLGCECDVFSCGDRGKSGLQASRSYNRHEYQVSFWESGNLHQAGETTMKLRADGKQIGGSGFSVGVVIKDRHMGDVEIARDLSESGEVATCRNSNELEFVAMGGDDAERGFANRTGGAQ